MAQITSAVSVGDYDTDFVAGDRRLKVDAFMLTPSGTASYTQVTRDGDGNPTGGGVLITEDLIGLSDVRFLPGSPVFQADSIGYVAMPAGRKTNGDWILALVDKDTGDEADASATIPQYLVVTLLAVGF